jgi:two-component system, cell cycle sensor histidine kinase and response regulator CckA
MSEREKTRMELVEELNYLRRRVAELELGLQREAQGGSSKVLLESVVRAVPDVVYRLDADGRIVFISEAIRKYGYEPDELIGTSIFELIHPDDRPKATHRINERRTGDRSTRLLEVRLLTKSQGPVSFELAVYADEDGPTVLVNAEGIYTSGTARADSFLYTQGVARDITERKWAARVLEKAKQELEKRVAERTAELQTANQELQRQIASRRQAEKALQFTQFAVDRASEAIFCVGEDGRFRYVNEESCRMLGYGRDELLALGVPDIVPELAGWEKWPEIWEQIRRSAGTRGDETQYRTRDGRLLSVEVTANYLEFEGRGFICNFVRDISLRKQLEEERDKLEEQLRHSLKMEAVGQLTAGVAHNFNNMLQGIVGNLYLAALDAPEAIKSLLGAAQSAADRAAEMVKQLMVFARQQGRQLPQSVDLIAVVRYVTAICRKTFDRKIQIVEQLPEEKVVVQGDAGQLQQVFMNLLLNARDALEEIASRAPTVSVQAETVEMGRYDTQALPAGIYVRVQIKDNGSGMNEKTRDRIFEPFFTTKPVDKGTGLGLSIVYAILQQHGGHIECRSEVDKGTCVAVYLPIAKVAEHGEGGAVKSEPEVKSGNTILIIEDEDVVRRSTARILERHGYDVLSAADGREGLEIFNRKRDKVNLVLLDLSMPVMTGQEVLAELRRLDPDLRVVIFTGYAARPEDFTEAQAVIQKPFNMTTLTGTVRRVLDQKAATPRVDTGAGG